ncbi:MAG: twin-arginine translocase TatA/TatE family subunit [bacterium]|nr:twin-arginine translocase TatA/TatE family subunit [bacterium]
MRLGWVEIILIVVILLLLFGAKRIPELLRGLGRGAREFKEGLRGDDDSKGDKESK